MFHSFDKFTHYYNKILQLTILSVVAGVSETSKKCVDVIWESLIDYIVMDVDAKVEVFNLKMRHLLR